VEATELGRMALAVLVGGLFARARVAELAKAVVERAAIAASVAALCTRIVRTRSMTEVESAGFLRSARNETDRSLLARRPLPAGASCLQQSVKNSPLAGVTLRAFARFGHFQPDFFASRARSIDCRSSAGGAL
jgi:hypothetical protein